MSNEPLLGPMAKAQRAKVQIIELETAIKAFFEITGHEITSEIYPEIDEEIWTFRLRGKLPPELSIRVGEILHNLRSALDNMIAEIVVKVAHRTDTKVEFPFGRNWEAFEESLSKQKKIPTEAAALIRHQKPFKEGGNKVLWLLHDFNRRDKHRMGLVPINLQTGGAFGFVSVWFGQILVIGSKKGQHGTAERTPFTNLQIMKNIAERRIWGAYGMSVIDPFIGLPVAPVWLTATFSNLGVSPDDSLEFLTTTPGAKIKTDFTPNWDVAFSNLDCFQGEPVVQVLLQAHAQVEHILLTFRNQFFPLGK